MLETAKVQKISQILLKPVVRLLSDDTAELSDSYIASLMETLSTQSEAVESALDGREGSEILAGRAGSEDSLRMQLEYVRPMSGGVHVLRLEPPVELEQVIQITKQLSAREDVEYAEPDQPRRR